MSTSNAKSTYYQSEIDRIDGEIRGFDGVIHNAQENKRLATEHREFLISMIGGDSGKPATAFTDLTVRKAVHRTLQDSLVALKPKEIVEYMLSKGYSFPGTTNRNTRVSNELFNLMKDKLVDREDGIYWSTGGAT